MAKNGDWGIGNKVDSLK